MLFGFNPSGFVTTNMIANINPNIVATIVGTITIYKVCNNAFGNSVVKKSIKLFIYHFLPSYALTS
ncbi:hypothetical protein BN175_1240002 [Clostridioides difficile T23]|uniref:Uncharacterized protein n=1 Tax=Clostridioides difficile TaxID=1496 RepID=A0A069AEW7_CLODI|nr:hypothetical protein BN171_1670007 [Clostridioides difficile E25]CCL21611.1 hypothetical protein BN172_2160002 [Clostridioides difficile T15]CCL25684.1 hypothetical protein BN173_1500005 [Clostridioides difficile T11]CCL29636.1 hypothetical protein BN174_1420005 [Clostridioides difficile E15]CCL33663.1 hypothetical protein BN175_1240002 [Clostridioides difficile T23]CCL46059.1 hypothetical protein BN178_630016 [Clostridioides difficile T42]CCL48696.1 hypothetical protein BN179_1410005 [Clo